MANPPITIGQFDNVPAPGSPIKSDWAQEISAAVAAAQAPAHGAAEVALLPYAGVGAKNVMTVAVPAVNYATVMTVTAVMSFAADSGETAVRGYIVRTVDLVNSIQHGPVKAVSSTAWAMISLTHQWPVAAGANPSFTVDAEIVASGGTTYFTASCLWGRYRT